MILSPTCGSQWSTAVQYAAASHSGGCLWTASGLPLDATLLLLPLCCCRYMLPLLLLLLEATAASRLRMAKPAVAQVRGAA